VWGLEYPLAAEQGAVYQTVRLDSVDVTPTSATIHATVAPLMPADAGWIQWQWGSTAPTDNSAVTAVTGESVEQAASTTLTGLTPGTTYHLYANGIFNSPSGGDFQSSTPQVTFTTPTW
jgi:hypothetical protein